ncbi:14896_t:CDS:2 [Gigaspora margarita]|uniref:14896_t:CDS:1 n=1 Tax=Gigaspora margarita TaxID=4874 RepID=A0ABN7VA21_GIGMA|nr:14896_t:CDS:2 [Gigaspora margarita]
MDTLKCLVDDLNKELEIEKESTEDNRRITEKKQGSICRRTNSVKKNEGKSAQDCDSKES